jgi:hypothetical protein
MNRAPVQPQGAIQYKKQLSLRRVNHFPCPQGHNCPGGQVHQLRGLMHVRYQGPGALGNSL